MTVLAALAFKLVLIQAAAAVIVALGLLVARELTR